MANKLPYKKGATRQQIKIIKEYFAGKSPQVLVREYQERHTSKSGATGKTIHVPRNEAEQVIYGALEYINWGGSDNAL